MAVVVQQSLHTLGLLPFENRLAGVLSGGNKRKLSVAMALLAEPPIIFLGEDLSWMRVAYLTQPSALSVAAACAVA